MKKMIDPKEISYDGRIVHVESAGMLIDVLVRDRMLTDDTVREHMQIVSVKIDGVEQYGRKIVVPKQVAAACEIVAFRRAPEPLAVAS